jgi:hypothetical protein
MKNLHYYRRTFTFFVIFYAMWLLLFYGSWNVENEYSKFHHDNFVKLCKTNYENIHENVRRYCSQFIGE